MRDSRSSGRSGDVRELDSIEHAPQNVELEAQDFQRALLPRPRVEVIERERETMGHIAPGFREEVALQVAYAFETATDFRKLQSPLMRAAA